MPSSGRLMTDKSQYRLSRAETCGYIAIIVVCAWFLTGCVYWLSRDFDAGGAHSGALYLYPGWIPGFKNDLSDIQWRQYRESMPALAAVLAAFVFVSRQIRARSGSAQHAFQIACGAALLLALHGTSALHVLLSLGVHYAVTQQTAGVRWLGPFCIWAIPIAVWLAARTTDGLPYAQLGSGWAALDENKGLMRWFSPFNLLLLRMVSWGCDLHWTRLRRSGHPLGFDGAAPARAYQRVPSEYPTLSPKERQLVNHDESWYQLGMMLRYCLYPPLYLSGPTITYNDFVCQARHTKRCRVRSFLCCVLHAPHQAGELVTYAIRLAVMLLLMELLTHTLYVNSFMRFKAWELPRAGVQARFTPVAMAGLSFYKLMFLWFKFTIIWRLARLFALADGIDPPENMLRCICNNYDISGFWRNWHASYNKWLVRYMYIPMGGSKNRLLVVWPIFTFVAIWHDLEWHLLRWAWLMALFMAPEVLCKAVINRPAWREQWNTAWFNHLCAAFAALYITVLMAINLVGYGMGSGGVALLLREVLGSPSLTGTMLLSFFSAAQLMLELRRREAAAHQRLR